MKKYKFELNIIEDDVSGDEFWESAIAVDGTGIAKLTDAIVEAFREQPITTGITLGGTVAGAIVGGAVSGVIKGKFIQTFLFVFHFNKALFLRQTLCF